MVEDSPHGLATWYNAAICTVCVNSLTKTAVDFADLHAWWNDPDMVESNDGELTAPLGSNAATKKEGHQFVAEVLPAVEAEIGDSPDAFNTVSSIRLPNDVIEMKSLKLKPINTALHVCIQWLERHIIYFISIKKQ